MFGQAMSAVAGAMGGEVESPPFDSGEAETEINDLAAKAEAGGDADLMTKLKSLATNPKIQGAVMDVKANGAGAAAKYASDPEIKSLLMEILPLLSG